MFKKIKFIEAKNSFLLAAPHITKKRNCKLTMLPNQMDQSGSSFWYSASFYDSVSLTMTESVLPCSCQVSRRNVQQTINLFKTSGSTNLGCYFLLCIATDYLNFKCTIPMMLHRYFCYLDLFLSLLYFLLSCRANSNLSMINLFYRPCYLLIPLRVTQINRKWQQ